MASIRNSEYSYMASVSSVALPYAPHTKCAMLLSHVATADSYVPAHQQIKHELGCLPWRILRMTSEARPAWCM
jgi:hypothetical protein